MNDYFNGENQLDKFELQPLSDICERCMYPDTKFTQEEQQILLTTQQINLETISLYNQNSEFGMTIGMVLNRFSNSELISIAFTGKAIVPMKTYDTDFYRSLPIAPDNIRKLAAIMSIQRTNKSNLSNVE